MMKRILTLLLAAAMLVMLIGCGGKKTVHCDGCGKEIAIDADSNMDEDWTIFCAECEKELGDVVTEG